MRVEKARHHLAMAQDRGDGHDVHAALEQCRREVVPAKVEVERDPGQGSDLEDRPAEEVLLLPVLDGEDVGRLPALPLDDRPGGRVEGHYPDPVALAPDRRLPALNVFPLEVQDLGLPHARFEAELD